ncbi:MAG TPA: cysteine desulfurase family protein [Acidimicrobiales bacterium]
MARHYLDHASTSPLRPEGREAMVEWLSATRVGDPARIHSEGHEARAAVEDARAAVAVLLGCRPRSVVFTSGATEAIAEAVWGGVERAGGHVVVPAIEHSAVRLSSAEFASAVSVVGCDRRGRVDPAAVLQAVRPGETALVHLQWGNHEVGTLQPVAEVVAACRELGVLVHVDAAQAAGRLPIAFDDLGADLVSVSAHKMGGPPGIGALLVRRGLRVRPLLMGGDQERARRAGYENVPAIVGWGAVATALAASDDEVRQRRLSERVATGAADFDGVEVYGDSDPAGRLPHIVCLGVDGIEPQAVLLGLDQAGIAVHSGSACASEDLLPSPVLEAMGVDAHRSLRVSVGWNTTDADIDALLDALPRVISHLRALTSPTAVRR